MDSNWRGPQSGSGAVGDSSMESGDWRAQLQSDSRQRIVNKIMDTLKRHLPFSGHEGLQELKKIAVRFEEKIYTAATSQSDYLRKISLKMLTMETRSQNPMPDAMQSNSGAISVNPSDPGSQVMQQVNNQGQQLPIPVPSNHPQQNQQILQQTMHNNIGSSGIQGSSSLSSALPPGTGLPQSTISNVSNQNPGLQNMQSMSGVQQNSVGNTMGPNNFANQRQIPGRQQQQQQLPPQQQQQQQQQQNQNQNSHYVYQQQLQQIAKQKLQVQQGNIAPSMQQIQQQQQQQNMLQPSVMQPTMMQSVQNQQSVVPQSSQPMMNHNQQSAMRQQRQQQVQVQPTQQQVQVQVQQPTQSNSMGQQQPNATNMQQNQMMGQQNTYTDMQQQQRLLGQQNKPQQHLIGQHNNGLSGMQQQHMGGGGQSSASGGQQQLLGTQSGNSGMQHMMQSKIPVQQQQNQQSSGTLLPTQVQQSQPQVMPHMQAQSAGQVGVGVGMQQQQQQNMMQQGNQQQRIPTPGGFQQQNVIDQQKQLFQQQRPMQEASSTSLDSTAQTGNVNGGDWQEEVYQKIKAMKDLYLLDLHDMHQKILGKLQQHDSLPQQPKNEQLEKLKVFKNMLERFMAFLQIPKHQILANYKDKLSTYEKQIVHVITSNRRKPAPTQQQQQQQPQQPQQQLPPPHMQSQSQQTLSQLTHENPMTSQMQTVNNLQGGTSLQQSSLSGGSNPQQTMMNSMQPTSNHDSASGPGVGAQQVSINPMVSHGAMGTLQPNPNMLHIKQQEQLLQSQQLKQFQNRQMQQQYLHKQQLMQQQQQFRQQQQGNQVNQMSQLHDSGGDMKLRQQQQQMGGVKPGTFQQVAGAQRAGYHQQMKPGGSPFSPQLIPGGGSPQISQHAASPQIDQNSMFKMQSANSPFTVPSPSTPGASPLPGDFERISGAVSGLTNNNVGNIGHGHGHGGQSSGQVLTSQSLAIGTPGISASPLLAEFTSPDGNGVVASIGSGKSSAQEQPLERLLKVVKSISANALSASVSDIGSVVSMIDRIAGSAPGNGSRAAVGEDLVAMTKCRLQARTFVSQDGATNGTRKMKRFTSAMPLNVVSSAGSVNDSLKQLTNAETSELDSTASSVIKRPRFETNHALLEEIKEINRGLIDTVVDISEEDVDPAAASSAANEGADGTVIKCSFSAVALGPNLKSQYASAQMSPIQPLRLLVPANYPNCSPILLDKFPVEVSKEYEDLSVKAKSRFSICLRSLSQPMSLKEIAKTWDVCARAIISEYAQQSGGGTFSSKYGVWENCLTAA